MPSTQNGVASVIIDELASFVHDLRREQAKDILHHLENENFDAYMAVLGVFCDGKYTQSSVTIQQEAKDIAVRLINQISNIVSTKERLSDWMEACREAVGIEIKKAFSANAVKECDCEDCDHDHSTAKEKTESPLKSFLLERYANGEMSEEIEEDYEQFAINLLKKVDIPIAEEMARNISLSFMKAISSELNAPIPKEEQRAIAKRTANGIRRLLTTAHKIHVTGRRVS